MKNELYNPIWTTTLTGFMVSRVVLKLGSSFKDDTLRVPHGLASTWTTNRANNYDFR